MNAQICASRGRGGYAATAPRWTSGIAGLGPASARADRDRAGMNEALSTVLLRVGQRCWSTLADSTATGPVRSSAAVPAASCPPWHPEPTRVRFRHKRLSPLAGLCRTVVMPIQQTGLRGDGARRFSDRSDHCPNKKNSLIAESKNSPRGPNTSSPSLPHPLESRGQYVLRQENK